ncbi:MAG: 1-acyl-sn-glycerol-3-phosphate acyltransferase [Anaerolineae bacterium]|nr:1-acyl-sn-glycerol-3-phosphate acyltransferase [Anaerolineae bacterium]
MSTDPKTPGIAKTGFLIPPEQLDTPGHRRMYWFAARLLNWIFDSIYHWKVIGLGNIPSKGPAIATINHLSAFDLPTLGTVMVNAGWTPGINMFTISKQELFEKPLLPHLLARMGMFPVNRNQSDVNAMRIMLSIFKRGAMLGIAPEGTRSPTGHLQLFQPGLAKLAIQKHIPILPIGLVGMEKVMPIGSKLPHIVPIEVHFGPVYELSDYYDKTLTPETLERAAWDMRARVAELLPEWMRELPPSDAEVRFGSVLSASSIKG